MKSHLVIGVFVGTVAMASTSHAQPLARLNFWPGGAFPYATNNDGPPAIAIGSFGVDQLWTVEVHLHLGSGFPLPTTVLQDIPGTGGAFDAALAYDPVDASESPAIAAQCTNPGGFYSTSFIEVQQSRSGCSCGPLDCTCPLFYRSGRLNPYSHSVSWSNSVYYDSGWSPQVAIGGVNCDQAIEVHQADAAGVFGLWARVGPIQSDGSVAWGNSINYDNGTNPSVAFTAGGNIAVEVHQATLDVGPLWSRTVSINDTVQTWSGSFQYDTGINPKVAVFVRPLPGVPALVLEVHQSQDGVSPLWRDTGALYPDAELDWQGNSGSPVECPAGQGLCNYDTGSNPAIAVDSSPGLFGVNSGVEVHLGATNGPPWCHFFDLQW
jgi:hypothetical protein